MILKGYNMSRPKDRLGAVIRAHGDIFSLEAAAKVLGLPNNKATKVLSRWAKQGWLTRIKQGLYSVVPIESVSTQIALENTWCLVPELFTPAYVGGWSAAEYWDFTEQIFRTICVITAKPKQKKSRTIYNIPFMVTTVSADLLFGTKILWIDNKKILISDPHKTIVDILYDPSLGGGIEHSLDCIKEYFKSKKFDPIKISEYAKRMNNGAIFKRLGFIAEKLLGRDNVFSKLCSENLTKGTAALDKNIKETVLITRWRLKVPKKNIKSKVHV